MAKRSTESNKSTARRDLFGELMEGVSALRGVSPRQAHAAHARGGVQAGARAVTG